MGKLLQLMGHSGPMLRCIHSCNISKPAYANPTSQHVGHANGVVLQLRAKTEQLAVRCARYDSLQVDLAEAQTQLAAHCAHFQVNASLTYLRLYNDHFPAVFHANSVYGLQAVRALVNTTFAALQH